VGVGLASAAGPDELAALVDEVLRAAGVEARQVRAVGTVELRAGHPALAALAWPVVAYPPAALAEATPAADPPAADPPARPPVAEPAALLAAGPGARLVVPKLRSAHATAALAVAADVAVDVRA
jgi:cobalamin biosynthesis protein CbiG